MTEPIKRKRGRPRKTDTALKVQSKDLTADDVKSVVKEKRHRNRPDLANYGQEFVEPGDNRKYLSFALESLKLPKIDYNDIDAVRGRIQWYFERCAEEDMKPGVVGLANALGVDRRTLWSWKTGERKAGTPMLAETIKQAYGVLEEMWEVYMQNGKISPPNGIFIGKNNFGYKDVQDVVVQPTNPYDSSTPDDVRGKYIDGMPSEVETDGTVE